MKKQGQRYEHVFFTELGKKIGKKIFRLLSDKVAQRNEKQRKERERERERGRKRERKEKACFAFTFRFVPNLHLGVGRERGEMNETEYVHSKPCTYPNSKNGGRERIRC